jgi:rfaE bifunctional protein nucleotidyltransferase chain/domain
MASVTVLTNGCFDLFHYGHLLHLEAARKLGDRLVVSVTRDRYVNKGPRRPVFKEEQRAQLVRSLRCVDDVILVNSSLEALKLIRPDYFVKGGEYVGNLQADDIEFCKRCDIKIAFTHESVYSSTKLLHYGSRHR